jgi:hypothetical protein
MIPILNAAILAGDAQSYLSVLGEKNILGIVDQMCSNRCLVLHLVNNKRLHAGKFLVEERTLPHIMTPCFHWSYTNPRTAAWYLRDYQELLYFCNGCVEKERDVPYIGYKTTRHAVRPVIDYRKRMRTVPMNCPIIKVCLDD